MPERVAIVGSRDFPDLERVRRYVRSLPPGTVVVSGTEPIAEHKDKQRGVDRTAIWEARKRGLQTVVFKADWQHYGNAAGPLRNDPLVHFCTRVVGFWVYGSRGTADALRWARCHGKPFEVAIA